MTDYEKKILDIMAKMKNRKDINNYARFSIESNDGLIELFLLLGADPNIGLEYKLNRMENDQVKLFYEYGAEIRENHMKMCIQQENVEIIEFLLEKGFKIDESHLRDAIKHNSKEMVELLLPHIEKIEDSIIQDAIVTSLEMVKLLLPKLGNKFPENSFYDGMNIWGKLMTLPNDVLEYILSSEHDKAEVLSEVINSKKNKGIDLAIFEILIYSYREADYDRIKLLIPYMDRIKSRFPVKLSTVEFYGILQKCTSVELNRMLILLKQNGLLMEKWGKADDYIIEEFHKKATDETLKILGIKK